jgi:hypothetical protein
MSAKAPDPFGGTTKEPTGPIVAQLEQLSINRLALIRTRLAYLTGHSLPWTSDLDSIQQWEDKEVNPPRLELLKLIEDPCINPEAAREAICLAVGYAGSVDITTELLRFERFRKAFTSPDKDGKTAVDWARRQKHKEIVELLEVAGVK